jgi:hypothetical protein
MIKTETQTMPYVRFQLKSDSEVGANEGSGDQPFPPYHPVESLLPAACAVYFVAARGVGWQQLA